MKLKFQISTQAREQAKQQVDAAVGRWEQVVTSGDPLGFVRGHQRAQAQMEQEFKDAESRVQEAVRRGARKTSGRIL